MLLFFQHFYISISQYNETVEEQVSIEKFEWEKNNFEENFILCSLITRRGLIAGGLYN